jgi:hypothetical protein
MALAPNASSRPLPALWTPSAPDEFLHPPAPSGHYSATETSYFGFNIPDRSLGGEIYMWFHPVLQVMSASVYIWRGIKSATLACEYVNHYHYLPYPQGDIDDYAIDEIGLRIKVLEPLKAVQVLFDDPARGVRFSVRFDAIMPPAAPVGRFHFAQAMRTRGQLELHGEHFEIDGYFTRDRSWSQERREAARSGPPLDWMCGVFDQDFAFHAAAFDDPDRQPEWRDWYPQITSADALSWGYLYKDGRLTALKRLSKRTHRDAGAVEPSGFEIVLEDVEGRRLELQGRVQARMPWQTWQNINVFFCLTRWECDGAVGWGDVHEIQGNDYVRRRTA